MDLKSLAKQFEGRKFGELILYHYKNQKFKTTISALIEIRAEILKNPGFNLEEWLDENCIQGINSLFWSRDCGEVLNEILEKAQIKLKNLNIKPTEDLLFNLFQIIILNFVYGIFKHPPSKAFIQKSIGFRFFRRLFF